MPLLGPAASEVQSRLYFDSFMAKGHRAEVNNNLTAIRLQASLSKVEAETSCQTGRIGTPRAFAHQDHYLNVNGHLLNGWAVTTSYLIRVFLWEIIPRSQRCHQTGVSLPSTRPLYHHSNQDFSENDSSLDSFPNISLHEWKQIQN